MKNTQDAFGSENGVILVEHLSTNDTRGFSIVFGYLRSMTNTVVSWLAMCV